MIKTLYPKFQNWSLNGSIWILSDLHFADADCKLMDPNWISIEEQQQILKNTIHKNDTFICLGDIGDKTCLKSIWDIDKKPYIVLILGNHDAPGQFKHDPYFDEVYTGPLFISDRILLSHEPIYTFYWYNIHGHHHSEMTYDEYGYGVNLACNICGYKPVSLKELIKKGALSKINNVHRFAIEERKEK